ncbi:hypothetical protein [Mucilaginibacter paludis]|uniref:Uncharacterized protein n=1 Tax=Mucilaginibacter paludis DSM 18603 TaxID=714943 RepID=H1XZG4_9SPHI|nr:hypothetical protein [Mucilaginibacter paludis]EHQ26608.1 hypothetical protein Mucpa_2493 [Mucilaginibacter paludis DSM 18603]
MKGVSMPTVEKKLKTIKGFGPGIVSENVKSHANDPFFIKKLEEATQTLQRVGLPGKKKE